MNDSSGKISFKALRSEANFSKPQLIIFVLAFAAIGYLLYRSFAAAPLVASLEAEQMSLPAGASVITDSTASAGKAVLLTSNGTATGAVNFPTSVSSLTIMARGAQCNGVPTMNVTLDGASLLTGAAVSATAWTGYSATPTNLIGVGSHTLAISFTNDYTKTKGNPRNQCSRDLYLDVTNFYGPVSITPAPAVTLSASPSTVTAGQSATLTWNSTNASACTASGAWSGSQPTSGSVSTGALNQNSTYALTCAGDGGSATASATVTVGAGFTTSLTQGMTITPPYTWTFNPGVSSVKGYFWADGNLLGTAAPNADGSYTFVIQSTTLSAGSHLLGHAWDLADGTHQSGPVNYDVTVATSSGTANPNFGTSLPAPLPQSSGTQLTGGPTSSLSSLFSGLSAGTTLCLHGGTYGQGLTSAVALSASGTESNPITIKSCPGETATIAQLIEVTGSYIRLSNLKIVRNNYPTDSRYGQSGSNPGGNVGIWLQGQHITLEKSEITGTTMSCIFGGGSYDQILANYVHDCGTTPDDHGIYYTSDHSLIANNIFYHNYDFGIQLGYTGAFNNIVANNTSVYNGIIDPTHPGSGTVTFSGTANNIFVNNIAAYNGQYGYKTYDTTNSLSHDDSYGNPSGSTNGTFSSILSLLLTNPMFVSSTDFHLQAASPMIGAGDPAYTPQLDFYGNARSTADLGAIGH